MKALSPASSKHYLPSPLGWIQVELSEQGIHRFWFVDQLPESYLSRSGEGEQAQLLEKLKTQVAEYFAGQRRQFDLPLAPRGTEFQQSVWKALCRIPYGQTWSYAQLAQSIGQPRASRAVGMANSRNPIGLLVPCHRVIGKNGQLTGYAGGLERKAWLLEHEQRCTESG